MQLTIILFSLFFVSACVEKKPRTLPPVSNIKDCNYKYSVWNSRLGRASDPIFVQTSYDSLADNLKDSLGCSICEEDQRKVTLTNGIEFTACYKISTQVEIVLNDVLDQGFPIETVTGYRPSMSRGPLDQDGNRTLFSNHSFGSAIDVNFDSNGLYRNCEKWSKKCTLAIGGAWEPGKNPKSIKPKSELVQLMFDEGLKWGGQIEGPIKDFMHFSTTGY